MQKNLKGKDGHKYGAGRFIQIEFDGTPKLRNYVMAQAKNHSETLRVHSYRVNEREYVNRSFVRMGNEMSPFRDEASKSPEFIREMWKFYVSKTNVD